MPLAPLISKFLLTSNEFVTFCYIFPLEIVLNKPSLTIKPLFVSVFLSVNVTSNRSAAERLYGLLRSFGLTAHPTHRIQPDDKEEMTNEDSKNT